MAWDKIEIKKEMVSSYQLNIADFYEIPIGNVKIWVPNFVAKKICASLWKRATKIKT